MIAKHAPYPRSLRRFSAINVAMVALMALCAPASGAAQQETTEQPIPDAQHRPPPAKSPEQPIPGEGSPTPDSPAQNATPQRAGSYVEPGARNGEVRSEAPTTSGLATICEGRTISKLEIVGHGRVGAEDILATAKLRRGFPCTDAEVTKDAKAIWNLGYFRDVRVEGQEDGPSGIALRYVVEERPAIGEVVFEGNDALDKSDLDEKVTLRRGNVLSEPAIKKQLTKVKELYAEKGFFLAEVKYELDPMPNSEVRIRFVIDEGAEVAVRRLRFVGNSALSAGEIKRYLQTGETGLFSAISSNDAYRRDVFDQDLNTIQALYYEQGYLLVEVGTPRIELSADRRYIDLSIPISEGPRFRVGRVKAGEIGEDGEDVAPLGGRKNLRQSVELNPGEWFSRTAIATSLQTITRFYRDKGYAKVQVVPQTDLDTERNIVHIGVQIRRGPLVYLQRINFSGNTKTRDEVLRRELRISEGQLYSQSLVEISKQRITALGYFETVEVAEESGSSDDRLILNFQIAEKPTGTFQLGLGFSSQETFLLTGQVQQQNLFGRGQSLSFDLQLSGIRQLAQLRFVEPYLYGTNWTAIANVSKILRQQASFDRDSTGADLTLGHPVLTSLLDDRLRMFMNYSIEHVDISPASGGVLGTGVGQNFTLYQPVPLANLFRSGLTNSGRLSLQWDTRNNRLFPTSGAFVTASSEAGINLNWPTDSQKKRGADGYNVSNFIRHRVNARFYQPLFWKFVGKLNVEWGLITNLCRGSDNPERDASEDPCLGVPIYERYFLGGITDVRGFTQQSIGPRTAQPSTASPYNAPSSAGIPFGGNMQFFYNLEIEFPILEAVGIRGVVFQDAGNAWNLERRLYDGPDVPGGDGKSSAAGFSPNLRFSAGLGIRWFSPLGPLRFEWGFPLDKRPNEDLYQFQFMVGNAF